jgi:pimeloyl-ACP methyl ester carboxylesterase
MSTYTDITFTSDDGLSLHARDYAGAGGPARLPVICIHGLTRNASDFDELAPRIASTRATSRGWRPTWASRAPCSSARRWAG